MNRYVVKKQPIKNSQDPISHWNYRGTGMPYHQWLAIKIMKSLLKQRRYPIIWEETNNGDRVAIYFK
jgi:hypothetical protein